MGEYVANGRMNGAVEW